MSFLAPTMLFGALAAGIPIALHFFYRSRYRTVPWAAMKFLLNSIEQTSRRLKFQELLLLLLRVAVLLLLAIALARPFTRATVASDGTAKGDAVDAVFLMDTSYSMAGSDGPMSRLDRARSSALAVIDHLPRNSTVQIVGCSDRGSLLGPKTPSNLGQAREILQKLDITHQATDLLPGVEEAAACLRRGSAPNKELYVFSDMQTRGWEEQATTLNTAFQSLSQQATIYLVRCGTRPVRNAAVVGITAQSGIPHTGERVGFAVLVRNSGGETLRDLTVSLEVDGQSQNKDSQTISELAPGETRAIPLTAKLEQAGLRIISASLQQDDLPADNRFDQVLMVHEQVRVLVIDGTPNETDPEKAGSYFLSHTLRPVPEPAWGKYHIQPRVVAPAQAAPALLADKDLCILVNVPLRPLSDETGSLSAEFVDRLAEFVKNGHGLMIFAGSNVTPESYNRVFWERHRLLPARLSGVHAAPVDQPLHLDTKSIDRQSFLAAFAEEPLDRIRMVDVEQVLEVEAKSESATGEPLRVPLRYSDGRPAVLTRRHGDGEVVLVTTTADPTWTNWPLLPTYLPFLHVSLSHLLHEQTMNHNRVAGEPLRWRLPGREGVGSWMLVPPTGEPIRLGPAEMEQGRPVVTVASTQRAGVYRIVPAQESPAIKTSAFDGSGAIFAVVPDIRESENLETLTDDQLDERLGFKAIHLTASDDPSIFAGTERLNWEWTKWLLMVLVGLVLGETLLAWICGRAW